MPMYIPWLPETRHIFPVAGVYNSYFLVEPFGLHGCINWLGCNSTEIDPVEGQDAWGNPLVEAWAFGVAKYKTHWWTSSMRCLIWHVSKSLGSSFCQFDPAFFLFFFFFFFFPFLVNIPLLVDRVVVPPRPPVGWFLCGMVLGLLIGTIDICYNDLY